MKNQISYQPFIKIMRMMHNLTKLDIRLNDQNKRAIFQIASHDVPAVINHQDKERLEHVSAFLLRNDPEHFYYYSDPYHLEYIAAGIWIDGTSYGSLRMGPMMSQIPSEDLIKAVISKNKLPVGERKTLEQFYQSLPVLSDSEINNIGELLVHLCKHHRINYKRMTSETPAAAGQSMPPQAVLEQNIKRIEDRYEQQNKLMDAIASGDKKEVASQMSQMMSDLSDFTNRVPGSPLRSSKNIGFVLNTMCRIAAERGGVHPVYLHHISERFANMIERATTIQSLVAQFQTMAAEYCELTRSVSTSGYSPIVKKAVDYIMLNLGGALHLNDIANHVHVNPSHLSRKFKQDTGMTVTEFINRKRIDEAKLYLHRGRVSVTDVAYMVGYNDINYFCKIFKKYTSETPSQYAKRR